MKNQPIFFFISVILLLSCQRKAVPEQFDGGDENGFFKGEGKVLGYYGDGRCYGEFKMQYFKPEDVPKYKGGSFKVETFKVGGGDTLFRKVVVDSSWVDVK